MPIHKLVSYIYQQGDIGMFKAISNLFSFQLAQEPQVVAKPATQTDLFGDELYTDESLEGDEFTSTTSDKSNSNKTSENPELRASDISGYTNGKVKLYYKDANGNFIEWTPNIDGDSVLNNYTESEIIQGLFNGTIKFTYTETGEELDLNTIRDILNGKLKPEDIKSPNKSDNSSTSQTTANETETTNQVRTQGELKDILADFTEGVNPNTSILLKGSNKDGSEPTKTINPYDLFFGISNLCDSENSEIAGIAQVISDLYKSLGADPRFTVQYQNIPNSWGSLRDGSKEAIITQAIFDAIQGDEILGQSGGLTTLLGHNKEKETLSVEDLLALDKNGDGSIIDELQELLTDPEFVSKVEFEIKRQENIDRNQDLIREMAGDDDKITEDEISANFGNNPIADLFKLDDGSFDLQLFIVLGAEKDENGDFSMSPIWFQAIFVNGNLNEMVDTDRDGNITKEEIAAFKETAYYKDKLNEYLSNH